jgi:hypothetical protein
MTRISEQCLRELLIGMVHACVVQKEREREKKHRLLRRTYVVNRACRLLYYQHYTCLPSICLCFSVLHALPFLSFFFKKTKVCATAFLSKQCINVAMLFLCLELFVREHRAFMLQQ